MMKTILFTLIFATLFISGADAQTAEIAAIERTYCTQYGPFFIRFDSDNAAGVFALPADHDLGVMIGLLHKQTFAGKWIKIDESGAIHLVFSEDWSSFEAAEDAAPNEDGWTAGWAGYMPPAGDPAQFVIDGETFVCR